jgi:hypothetical protein
MNRNSAFRFASMIAPLLLLAMAGCAHHESPSAAPPPPMPTTAAAPEASGFTAEEYVEGEATVVAVNRTDRKVTLQNARGRAITVQVPADVNLNRVTAGDNVLIGLLQSVSARVLPPGSAALGNTLEVASTQPGQPEGRAWGQQLTVVAEITAIDLVNHTVTLRGAEGNSDTISVKNPQMQQRMANLQVGDLVELTYSEALATRLLPRR